MSIIRVDGFDGHGVISDLATASSRMFTSGWAGGPGSFTDQTATGVGLSWSAGYYDTATLSFDPVTNGNLGFRFFTGTMNFARIAEMACDNYAGSLTHPIVLYRDPTGAISIFYVPDGGFYPGTLLGYTPVNTLYPNVWHYIEVGWQFSGPNIILEIRVDGNTVFAATVSANGNPAVNQFTFLSQGINGQYAAFDDFFILRNDGIGLTGFQGDCVVHEIEVVSDAGLNETTQYGGSIGHWTNVSGFPVSEDSQYLFSNTSGQRELFNINTLPSDMIDVLGVQVNVRARKDSAGIAKMDLALKSATVTSYSTDRTPTTSWMEHHYVLESDPAGGAWTKSAVQASQIGFKVV